ncbi:MAG: DUF1501 domain-containing protein [Planctomycetes bacterium]|nr:DUF1501 domain-containing protein [Planctomycetota bacterium]
MTTSNDINHVTPGGDLLNRRGFLGHAGTALGSIALTSLLQRDGLLAADSPFRPKIRPEAPLAARSPQFAAKAKQVLLLFCSGACSHIDTWDYKPELIKRNGQPLPGAGKLVTFQGAQGNLTRSPWAFKPRGECGKQISELLPHLAELADEMCFLHSMTGKSNTHGPAENFMSTGFTRDGFPSMGAWTNYALGSEADNLPAFVAITDPRGVPQSSVNNWGSGFLPAVFQGTPFNAGKPIRNLARPKSVSRSEDNATRSFLKRLNEKHREQYPGDSELSARIASYELAARMQLSVPEVSDISSERLSTLKMYGADSPNTIKAGFARNCILARRLIERGVRFVQLFNGAYAMGEGVGNWDGHKSLEKQYNIHGLILDQPAAALLKDMKRRGLLEETLFVWVTEFGRMPTFQKGASGRDHNPSGFTVWLSGAGVKTPFSYGATDDFGYKAVENVLTVHDLHATILHLLGFDHERLTFYHNGINRRLTNVHGRVIREILE